MCSSCVSDQSSEWYQKKAAAILQLIEGNQLKMGLNFLIPFKYFFPKHDLELLGLNKDVYNPQLTGN